MKKKIILTLTTFVLALSFGAITAFAGSSFGTATEIKTNTDYSCTLTSSQSMQYYSFTPSKSGYYNFFSTGEYDTYGYAYNASYSQIAYDDDSGVGNNFNVSCYLKSGTKYYLAARMYNSGYTGSFTVRVTFEQTISNATVTLSATSYTYDGNAKKPVPKVVFDGVTLTKGVDYEVNYSNNVSAGKASVIIYGIGDYSGSVTKTFTINKKSLSKASVKLSTTSYTYSGSVKKPSPTVTLSSKKLKKGSDFSVSYSNNTNAGKGKVTIKGTGNYTGTITKTFKINPKTIKKCKIYNATYSGKAKTPAVYYTKKVYDADYDYYYTTEKKYKKDKDYKIKVSGKHKSIGEYKVTIKFKGNYKGTVKKTFKILPKPVKKVKTKTVSTSEISVSWSKVSNVSGYKIYRWNSSKGKYSLYKTTSKTSCKIKRAKSSDESISFYIRTYKKVGKKNYYNLSEKNYYDFEYVKPSKPSFKIVKNGFGEFTINFKSYNYYQVQVSRNKKFKDTASNTVSTYRGYTNSVYWYNCRSGEKYYVRARKYYYNKNGNLKVGPWSSIKTVTPY